MAGQFEMMVRQRLDEILLSGNFHFEKLVEAGGAAKTIALYAGPRQKIAVYRSLTDGEINCVIGKATADVRDLENGEVWTCLATVLRGQREMSIEELLAQVPNEPKGAEAQLDGIAGALRQHLTEVTTSH